MAEKKDLRGSIMKMREVAQLLTGWADDMESSLEAGKSRRVRRLLNRQLRLPRT